MLKISAKWEQLLALGVKGLNPESGQSQTTKLHRSMDWLGIQPNLT
jgi:hypothetical protein